MESVNQDGRRRRGREGNPKSQTRNPKQGGKSKEEKSKTAFDVASKIGPSRRGGKDRDHEIPKERKAERTETMVEHELDHCPNVFSFAFSSFRSFVIILLCSLKLSPFPSFELCALNLFRI